MLIGKRHVCWLHSLFTTKIYCSGKTGSSVSFHWLVTSQFFVPYLACYRCLVDWVTTDFVFL